MAGKVIPLQGPFANMGRQFYSTLKEVLQSKFGCQSVLEGVDFNDHSTTAPPPSFVREKRFSGVLPGGVQLSVWKDDLTSLRVDTVVNAANTKLEHYGGLALALSHAGGPQIQFESRDFIQRHGELSTGDAVEGSAGSLPCKILIHAVGPCLPAYPTPAEVAIAEPLLKKAVENILRIVVQQRLKSVAIPAISSGLFNFPRSRCADVIVSTVKDFCQRSSPGCMEEILLVNNDEPTVREMDRACRQLLTSHQPLTYSQAAADRNPSPFLQLGNVLMTLKLGRIEEQKTDVIVNTLSPDRNLNVGAISRALLSKAGFSIQEELTSAGQHGSILVTSGHALQCKLVYHTLHLQREDAAAPQVLYVSVSDCLWTTVSNQMRSISFPAIGTGPYQLSSREVANTMTRAVAEFARNCPGALTVDFVIFPSDLETYKVFEEAMTALKTATFTPALKQAEPVNLPPRLILSGLSDESTLEAKRWLNDLLKSPGVVTIHNNFIQHFGEEKYTRLLRLRQDGVSIKESFDKGQTEMVITGKACDVVSAALQVEAMLCGVHRDFVLEEKQSISWMAQKNVLFERRTVDRNSPAYRDMESEFKKEGLLIVKVERVETPTLQRIFDQKKVQLQCFSSQRMFQLIPAQFSDMVCQIGFHAVCAPPTDPAFGEGIYFSRTVRKALEVWQEQREEYLYFVEAEVLTGRSTPGSPGIIAPPATDTDPRVLFDCVSGGPEVSVVFSPYQALPRSIITCLRT